MNKTIAIIKGDGIGPEIVTEAMGILDTVAPSPTSTRRWAATPSINSACRCRIRV